MADSKGMTLYEWIAKENGSDYDVITINNVVYTRRQLKKQIDVYNTTVGNLHVIGEG